MSSPWPVVTKGTTTLSQKDNRKIVDNSNTAFTAPTLLAGTVIEFVNPTGGAGNNTLTGSGITIVGNTTLAVGKSGKLIYRTATEAYTRGECT